MLKKLYIYMYIYTGSVGNPLKISLKLILVTWINHKPAALIKNSDFLKAYAQHVVAHQVIWNKYIMFLGFIKKVFISGTKYFSIFISTGKSFFLYFFLINQVTKMARKQEITAKENKL